jgi:hypothetical protein
VIDPGRAACTITYANFFELRNEVVSRGVKDQRLMINGLPGCGMRIIHHHEAQLNNHAERF